MEFLKDCIFMPVFGSRYFKVNSWHQGKAAFAIQYRQPSMSIYEHLYILIKFSVSAYKCGPINCASKAGIMTMWSCVVTQFCGAVFFFLFVCFFVCLFCFFPTVQQGGQVFLTCIHYNNIFSPTLCSVAT